MVTITRIPVRKRNWPAIDNIVPVIFIKGYDSFGSSAGHWGQASICEISFLACSRAASHSYSDDAVVKSAFLLYAWFPYLSEIIYHPIYIKESLTQYTIIP
jgi:hypothetical protein